MEKAEFDRLVSRIERLGRNGRKIVAVAGAPGSGKSTLAEQLRDVVLKSRRSVSLVPMDGFHYDDAVLDQKGLRSRKGAPETFDVGGLLSLLMRLRANDEKEVAIPVFDRALEISRNAARMLPQDIELIIVEGNYLLLDQPGWRDLADLFDLTVMLHVPVDILDARLRTRWIDLGFSDAETAARVEANDLPNGRTVAECSRAADLTLFVDDKADEAKS